MKIKLDTVPVFLQLLAHRERTRWRVLEVVVVRRGSGPVTILGKKLHDWKAASSGALPSDQGSSMATTA